MKTLVTENIPSRAPKNTALHRPARTHIRSILEILLSGTLSGEVVGVIVPEDVE